MHEVGFQIRCFLQGWTLLVCHFFPTSPFFIWFFFIFFLKKSSWIVYRISELVYSCFDLGFYIAFVFYIFTERWSGYAISRNNSSCLSSNFYFEACIRIVVIWNIKTMYKTYVQCLCLCVVCDFRCLNWCSDIVWLIIMWAGKCFTRMTWKRKTLYIFWFKIMPMRRLCRFVP